MNPLRWNALPGMAAAGLVVSSSVLLQIPASISLTLLALCGTMFIYLLDHGLPFSPEDRLNHPERQAWFRRHSRSVLWIALLLTILCVSLLIRQSGPARGVVGLLAVGSLFYLFPLLPGRRRLKEWPGTKPLLLGFLWISGGVLLPAVDHLRHVQPAVWFLMGYRLLYLMPNFLLNDLADQRGDRTAGIHSLAGQLPQPVMHRFILLLPAAALIPLVLLQQAGCSLFLLLIDWAGMLIYPLWRNQLSRLDRDHSATLLDLAACWPWLAALTGLAMHPVL